MAGSTSARSRLEQEVVSTASAGKPIEMLEALYASRFLDGLTRRMRSKWKGLIADDVDDAVAMAVGVLYRDVKEGKVVSDPFGYLWRVTDRKAFSIRQQRTDERATDPVNLDRIESEPDLSDDDEARGEDGTILRKKTVEIARSLLPQIGQANVVKVMEFILEAIEQGAEEITTGQIVEATGLSSENARQCKSRGFRRLERAAKEAGYVGMDFDLGMTEDDEGTMGEGH